MDQRERAEKYFELFMDATRREKRLKSEFLEAYKMRNRFAIFEFFGPPKYFKKEAKKKAEELRKTRAAKNKIYKTLVSILGVLKNEK